jgi:hypothetical protein
LLLGQKIAVMRRGPGSAVKEEFVIDQPYPRAITDEAVAAAYSRAEASVQAEVGVSLNA